MRGCCALLLLRHRSGRCGWFSPPAPLCRPPAALLHRYYRSKLRQLSRVAAARLEAGEEEGDGMVEGEAEWGRDGGSCGGLGMEPGWARSLQDVAAYLRLLGLEVGG